MKFTAKMENIEVISCFFSLLVLVVLGGVLVNELREIRNMKRERKKCFLMISRCSVLLDFLQGGGYATDLDFQYLKHIIYRSYARICEMPFKVYSSEKERLILAEGLHDLSVIKGYKDIKYEKSTPVNSSRFFCVILNMVIAEFTGFSMGKDNGEDLEWICYLWLAESFMLARSSQAVADWDKLKCDCLTVEQWIANWNIDSPYLKDKIRECRN